MSEKELTIFLMKQLLFIFSFLVTVFSQAQEWDKSIPVSWQWELQAVRASVITLPPIDLEAVVAQDSLDDLDKTLPWRYGVVRDISINFKEQGVLTILPNGDKVWRLAIKSPDALNLSINFDDFYLPPGGRVHLYNATQTDVSKTYMSNQNTPNKILGSWFVEGDEIWIEYFQPAYSAPTATLKIASIIHGYRMGEVNRYVEQQRGLNDSGDCNYDVNCPIGTDFEEQKDILKKAVALLTLGNGYLCSAVLINTTLDEKMPYLLTANHCLETSNPAYWSVRFNWMSPSPICGEALDSNDIETNFTMSGAQLRANNPLSDFALVELYNAIPQSWDVAFAGWDRTDEAPVFEVGIHHPNGDIMKVCRDDTGAVKEVASNTQVWLIKGVSAGNGDGWEIGTTESGSSGSPLFDQNGRIIGQLYAGQAFCNGTETNNDYDVYGRFAVSWDAGSTAQSRLKDWLDPSNTGVFTTDTVKNNLNTPDFGQEGQLRIYPNPVHDVLFIENNRFSNLIFVMYDLTGKQVLNGNLSNTYNEIQISLLDKGIYFIKLTDADSQSSITKKIIVR